MNVSVQRSIPVIVSHPVASGAEGVVYRAMRTDTSETVAIKCIALRDSQQDAWLESLKRKLEYCMTLNHPNIVRHIHHQSDPYVGVLYEPAHKLLMEYCEGGTLTEAIQRHEIAPCLLRKWTVQMLDGLTYLHEQRCVHRDIKGDNILMSSRNIDKCAIKIADLGAVKKLDSFTGADNFSTNRGTYPYMSPEMIADPELDEELFGETVSRGSQTDLWSLGCVLVQILTGRMPQFFSEKDGDRREVIGKSAVLMFILNGGTPTVPAGLQMQVDDFVRQCFRRNPNSRPSAAVLRNHSFLTADKAVVSQWLLPTRVVPVQPEFLLCQDNIRPNPAGSIMLRNVIQQLKRIPSGSSVSSLRKTKKIRHEKSAQQCNSLGMQPSLAMQMMQFNSAQQQCNPAYPGVAHLFDTAGIDPSKLDKDGGAVISKTLDNLGGIKAIEAAVTLVPPPPLPGHATKRKQAFVGGHWSSSMRQPLPAPPSNMNQQQQSYQLPYQQPITDPYKKNRPTEKTEIAKYGNPHRMSYIDTIPPIWSKQAGSTWDSAHTPPRHENSVPIGPPPQFACLKNDSVRLNGQVFHPPSRPPQPPLAFAQPTQLSQSSFGCQMSGHFGSQGACFSWPLDLSRGNTVPAPSTTPLLSALRSEVRQPLPPKIVLQDDSDPRPVPSQDKPMGQSPLSRQLHMFPAEEKTPKGSTLELEGMATASRPAMQRRRNAVHQDVLRKPSFFPQSFSPLILRIWGIIWCAGIIFIHANVPSHQKPSGRVIPVQFVRVISSKARTKVFQAVRTDTVETIAVKVILMDFDLKKRDIQAVYLKSKWEGLGNLDHPNIVRHFQGQEVSETSYYEPRTYEIVMEFCDGRTLQDLVRTFAVTPHLLQKWTGQLVDGIAYLHENRCVHRKIQADNILISSAADVETCTLKIAALGDIKSLSEDTVQTSEVSREPSTWASMSPELINGTDEEVEYPGENVKLGRRTDIWSLACVVIAMINGDMPEFHKMQNGRLTKISGGIAIMYFVGTGGSPTIPVQLPGAVSSFIQQCLQRNPNHRPFAVQLKSHMLLRTDKDDVAVWRLPERTLSAEALPYPFQWIPQTSESTSLAYHKPQNQHL